MYAAVPITSRPHSGHTMLQAATWSRRLSWTVAPSRIWRSTMAGRPSSARCGSAGCVGLVGLAPPQTTSRPAGRHPKEQVESGWRFLPCYMYTAPVIPLHQFTTAWWWWCHVRPHKAGGRYGIGGRLRCDSTRSQTRVSIFPALLTTPVRYVFFNNYYMYNSFSMHPAMSRGRRRCALASVSF